MNHTMVCAKSCHKTYETGEKKKKTAWLQHWNALQYTTLLASWHHVKMRVILLFICRNVRNIGSMMSLLKPYILNALDWVLWRYLTVSQIYGHIFNFLVYHKLYHATQIMNSLDDNSMGWRWTWSQMYKQSTKWMFSLLNTTRHAVLGSK